MSAEIRIGVVGCGAIARHVHLRSLRRLRGARVVALADPSAAAIDAARRLAPDARLHEGVEQLLRDDLDAVVVTSPSNLHAAHGVAVLRSGRALFLEKPVATTAADASGLRRALAGVDPQPVAATGFNRRFHPVFRDLADVVRSGTVGRCRLIRTVFCEPVDPAAMPAWKRARAEGGGVLLDLVPHHIDLARRLTGEEVVSVSAELRSERTEHDTADVSLHLPTVEVEIHASFRAARVDAIEVIGDKGIARADRYSRTLVVTTTSARSHSARRRRVLPSIATARYRAAALARPALEPSYGTCLGAFVAAVGGQPSVELATLDDGLRAVDVVVAAEAAASTGRAVEVECAS